MAGLALDGTFVLGAGASRAIAPSMPLAQDLASELEARLDLKIPGDFEAWLSFLAVDQPMLDLEHNLRNRALFQRIARELVEVIRLAQVNAMRDGPPQWLVDVTTLWSQHQATVISFNYDTLIESTMTMVGSGTGYAHSRTRHLKLHGSIDESWDPVDTPTGVLEPSFPLPNWGSTAVGGAAWMEHGRFRPFLVPPTVGKSEFYGLAELRDRWLRAAHAIETSKSVTLMGYSLPPADHVSGELLKKASHQAAGHALFVADLDAGAVGERLTSLGLGVERSFDGHSAILDLVDEMFRGVGRCAADDLRDKRRGPWRGVSSVQVRPVVVGKPERHVSRPNLEAAVADAFGTYAAIDGFERWLRTVGEIRFDEYRICRVFLENAGRADLLAVPLVSDVASTV